MLQYIRLRGGEKIFGGFAKSKRGVSTVIGAIFFSLVIMMSFSMIMWEITQYDAYMQIVNERNRLDRERESEIIEIVSVSILDNKLSASVRNKGAVMAHLVNLWITEYVSSTPSWHRNYTISYYLNPGNTTTNIGQELEVELNPDLTYEVKIVTERGNIVTKRYYPVPLPGEEAPPVQAFGAFSLDWFYFKFSSKTYPVPRSAGSVNKQDDYVAFYVKVINNYDETVTILSPSMIMLLVAMQEPHLNLVEDVVYSKWETDWVYITSQKHTGSYSIQAGEYSNYLTSIDLDASDATSITVSFWYRDHGIDDNDDVYLQFWDGSTYIGIFELGNTSPEDTWHYYTVTTSDPQYFVSNFKIRFDGRSIDNGEYLWIDDVLIKKISGEGVVTLLSDGFEYTEPVITAYDDANPITVGPHETETLIFAAADAGVNTWAWVDKMPYYNSGTEGAIVMTALVFTMESHPGEIYAQSLPFQALVLSD